MTSQLMTSYQYFDVTLRTFLEKMASDNVNEQRVVIKFYILLGKSFSDIREDLHTVYGDCCISKSAISKWMNRFKEGRDTTKSDKRKG